MALPQSKSARCAHGSMLRAAHSGMMPERAAASGCAESQRAHRLYKKRWGSPTTCQQYSNCT